MTASQLKQVQQPTVRAKEIFITQTVDNAQRRLITGH